MRNFIIHNPLVPIICGLTTGTLLGRIKEVMKLNKARKEYRRRVDEFVNKNQK